MNIIHVQVHVRPEFIEEFKLATLENARKSKLEPGVAGFDALQDLDDPTHFLLVEIYKTPEAPAQHKNTVHYQVWRDAVQKMMAEPRRSEKYRNIDQDQK